MMHGWASDAPTEGVSSARGSVEKPAWRVSDTADVMFNIDNSPERNGLWSFRKILCVFFFFFLFSFLTTISWPCAWIPAIHQFDLMGRYPQSSYHHRWNELCLWKHHSWGEVCFCTVSVSFETRTCFWDLCLIGLCFHFYFCGMKKKKKKVPEVVRKMSAVVDTCFSGPSSGFARFSSLNTNHFKMSFACIFSTFPDIH